MDRQTDGFDACFRCGNRAGYNRAIVDRTADVTIGRLCVRCERDTFGTFFVDGYRKDDDACALCDRDAHYELPLFKPIVVEGDEAIVCKVSTTADPDPVPLCDEHLHGLTGRAPDVDYPTIAQRGRIG